MPSKYLCSFEVSQLKHKLVIGLTKANTQRTTFKVKHLTKTFTKSNLIFNFKADICMKYL